MSGEREFKPDPGTLSITFGADRAAMDLDQLPDDRQTDAGRGVAVVSVRTAIVSYIPFLQLLGSDQL